MEHFSWASDSQEDFEVNGFMAQVFDDQWDEKKEEMSTGTPDEEGDIDDSIMQVSARPNSEFVDDRNSFEQGDYNMNLLPTDMGLSEPSMNRFLKQQLNVVQEVPEAIEEFNSEGIYLPNSLNFTVVNFDDRWHRQKEFQTIPHSNSGLQEYLFPFGKLRLDQQIIDESQPEDLNEDAEGDDRISLEGNVGDESNEDAQFPGPVSQQRPRYLDDSNEIVDSGYLKNLHFKQDYDYDKGINMPKYFVRLFFRYSDQLSRDFPVDRYLSNRHSILKKLEVGMRSKTSNTLKDLLKLFGYQQPNQFQTEEAKRRRKFFQGVLCSISVKLEILASELIVDKEHYLYSMKIYEWRLNSGGLVGNLN